MCQLRARRRMADSEGFTLLEVVVAITVLAIGLMASGLLMSNTYQFSVRSRYMAEAGQLCSEKLEDLGRFPLNDEHVTVMSGDNACGIAGESCEGSLNADTGPATITVAGSTYSIYYYDAVYISVNNASGGNGTFQETYQDPNSSVTTCGNNSPYVTLTFSPNGQTPTSTCSATPPSGGETFDRRWVIEQDQPVAGVRRVTVLVTLMYTSFLGLKGNSPITFQMSMVRP